MTQFAGLETTGLNDLPQDRGRWLIHGPQGSGKSTLASTIAKLGKCLYVDLVGEKGVRSFMGAPYSKYIDIVRPTSIQDLDDIFWELKKGNHSYESTVLDSVTAAQKAAMRFMLGHDETAVREIRKNSAPADMRTWGQTLDIMTDMATFWYGLADGQLARPMHVVFIAQTKVVDDEFAKSSARTPDVQKGALSIMLAATDYILYCEEEENIDALADDTLPPSRHIVRFGGHPGYRTKARVPIDLRGKIPSVLGRGQNPPDLAALSQTLRIGGVPAPAAKAPATEVASA